MHYKINVERNEAVASKKGNSGSNALPGAVIALGAHVIADLITEASCPVCGNQVVLYFCTSCKKIVRPKRRGLPGAA